MQQLLQLTALFGLLAYIFYPEKEKTDYYEQTALLRLGVWSKWLESCNTFDQVELCRAYWEKYLMKQLPRKYYFDSLNLIEQKIDIMEGDYKYMPVIAEFFGLTYKNGLLFSEPQIKVIPDTEFDIE